MRFEGSALIAVRRPPVMESMEGTLIVSTQWETNESPRQIHKENAAQN